MVGRLLCLIGRHDWQLGITWDEFTRVDGRWHLFCGRCLRLHSSDSG